MCVLYVFFKESLRISYQGENLFVFLDIAGMHRNNLLSRMSAVTIDVHTHKQQRNVLKAKHVISDLFLFFFNFFSTNYFLTLPSVWVLHMCKESISSEIITKEIFQGTEYFTILSAGLFTLKNSLNSFLIFASFK